MIRAADRVAGSAADGAAAPGAGGGPVCLRYQGGAKLALLPFGWPMHPFSRLSLAPIRSAQAMLRLAVAGLSVVFVAVSGTPPAMAQEPAADLTVALHQGLSPATINDVLVAPFARASGLVVDATLFPGGAEALPTLDWDVIAVDGQELAAGCKAGLFAPVDPLFDKAQGDVLGDRGRFVVPPSGCGIPAFTRGTVLAWDADKVQRPPDHPLTWADFWDVAKVPGKRGLRWGPRGTLELALLADGVAPAEIYKTLSTSAGVDRAFRRLDQLRPYLVWWHDDAEAASILGSGEVLMTSAPDDTIGGAEIGGRRFGVQWQGGLVAVVSWAVQRGTPARDAAWKFLAYATDAANQAALAQRVAYGPVVAGADKSMPQPAWGATPTAHLPDLLPIDEAFWQTHLDALTQRFADWVKG